MLRLFAFLFTVCSFSIAESQRERWNNPFAPFRIIGNVYYVGAAGVSSFLIIAPEGDILLDGGLPETAPLIEKNIAALGFRLHDVKLLLNSHAHYDHAGGLAALQRATGAQVAISRADAETVRSGHQLSFGKGQSDSRFPAAQVGKIIDDGDVVAVGSTKMTAHLTPGHTKGCTTWSMATEDHGKIYQVVFYCSTSVAGQDLVGNAKYPQVVADYERSFDRLLAMPCDVFLGPHPEFFDMERKRKAQLGGKDDAFVDRNELRTFVTDSRQQFEKELRRPIATAK